jgi:flagellar FliL protein
MAKKPKKSTKENADGAEGGGAAPAEQVTAPKSRRKLVFAGAGVLVLAAAGGGGYFFLRTPSPEVAAPVKKPIAFVDIREMTINLAPEPNEAQRYLKFRVTLEVNDQKTVTDIQPLLPRVEDTFQVFVRELRATDLEGSAGVYRLREELLRRVNLAVYPSKVDAVLFKDIVLQ